MPIATRAHIVLPEELLRTVDRLVGKRMRSRFVEAAIQEKIAREALSSALTESAGILNPADYPEWETPEKASTWVHASRRQEDERLRRRLGAPTD